MGDERWSPKPCKVLDLLICSPLFPQNQEALRSASEALLAQVEDLSAQLKEEAQKVTVLETQLEILSPLQATLEDVRDLRAIPTQGSPLQASWTHPALCVYFDTWFLPTPHQPLSGKDYHGLPQPGDLIPQEFHLSPSQFQERVRDLEKERDLLKSDYDKLLER